MSRENLPATTETLPAFSVGANGNLDIVSLATALCKSGYFSDVKSISQAIVKVLVGRELGVTDMASVMNIHIIQGKPALSAQIIGSLVKRSGLYKYAVSELTNQKCIIKWWSRERKDGPWEPLADSSFTIEDAKAARCSFKEDSSWTKTPRNMLMWRALTLGQRMHCPEVTIGCAYTPDELGAVIEESGNIQVAEVVEPVTRMSAMDRIKQQAETVETAEEVQP